MLWFCRDKGAVVQAVLIPFTFGLLQLFNLRGLLDHATSHWNGMAGAAVICGSYFLFVLGPRSLASEGAALWIPMTWPLGLEDLLKAKARLWWMLSNAIVGVILGLTLWMFPTDWWRIASGSPGGAFSARAWPPKRSRW